MVKFLMTFTHTFTASLVKLPNPQRTFSLGTFFDGTFPVGVIFEGTFLGRDNNVREIEKGTFWYQIGGAGFFH